MISSSLDLIALCKQLMAKPSISPQDAGCMDIIMEQLKRHQFTIHAFQCNQVSNLWAYHGQHAPLLAFAGHTDVVPAGPASLWSFDPFCPTISNELLFGRGACDMKGSLAAFIVAACQYVTMYPHHPGTLAFMITSGEEGNHYLDGTPKILDYLHQNNVAIDFCLVGEPTSQHQLADTIKIGRRGSLTGQGSLHHTTHHVAYAHSKDNVLHQLINIAQALLHTTWETPDPPFEPTCFNITNITTDYISSNVTPAECGIEFNLRYAKPSTQAQIISRIESLFDKYAPSFKLSWQHSGAPYLSLHQNFTDLMTKVIYTHTHHYPTLSTNGGTSDGRFIAPHVKGLVEIGLLNTTAHQVNEHIALKDLRQLAIIYEAIIKQTLEQCSS